MYCRGVNDARTDDSDPPVRSEHGTLQSVLFSDAGHSVNQWVLQIRTFVSGWEIATIPIAKVVAPPSAIRVGPE